jgi:hypothetical protein
MLEASENNQDLGSSFILSQRYAPSSCSGYCSTRLRFCESKSALCVCVVAWAALEYSETS